MKIAYKILILSLLLIFVQSIFIRKQTIKNDDVLGQVVILEEYNTQGQDDLDSFFVQSAGFIEEELDYASQLANVMLSSLENELIDDQLIQDGGPVFNTLENLKGVVSQMQKAEHDYLEEVKHEREDNEQVLSDLEKQVQEESSKVQKKKGKVSKIENTQTPKVQYELDKKSNFGKKLKQDEQNFDGSYASTNGKQENLNKLFDEIQEIIEKQEQRENVEDLITDYGKVDQEKIKEWIQDDYESQEETEEQNKIIKPENIDVGTQSEQKIKSNSQNFNSTPSKAKIDKLNIGLGPQISMKNTTYTPLYKDPSIILGVISLLLVLGAFGYYLFRSKMNLRKSSSTILEQGGEISLSQKNNLNYEKVKLI